jgi:hypothetical protein
MNSAGDDVVRLLTTNLNEGRQEVLERRIAKGRQPQGCKLIERPGTRAGMPAWCPAAREAGQWSEHKDTRLESALAYYSIFSLGPLIVIAIAGLVFGAEAVQPQVFGSLHGLLGDIADRHRDRGPRLALPAVCL